MTWNLVLQIMVLLLWLSICLRATLGGAGDRFEVPEEVNELGG